MTKPTQKRANAIATISALLAGFASAGASHAGEMDPPTMRVSYADLNLSTVEGAKVLYGRLRNASKAVCRDFEDKGLAKRFQWQRCVDEAMRNAVLKVNAPLLSEIYGLPANRVPQLAVSREQPGG